MEGFSNDENGFQNEFLVSYCSSFFQITFQGGCTVEFSDDC